MCPLGTLDAFIKFNGRFQEHGAIAALCKQVLIGLDRVHSAGAIHGDVKPQNILIFPNGICKLSWVTSGAFVFAVLHRMFFVH